MGIPLQRQQHLLEAVIVVATAAHVVLFNYGNRWIVSLNAVAKLFEGLIRAHVSGTPAPPGFTVSSSFAVRSIVHCGSTEKLSSPGEVIFLIDREW
jgi:hypothetical protein